MLALVQDADARPRGLHPGQFAPRSGGETPRLIEPMPHVRAGSFVGTFRPCRRQEAGMARAATHPRRWLFWKGQVERQRMAVLRQQDGDSKNLQDILSVNSLCCLLLRPSTDPSGHGLRIEGEVQVHAA